MSDTRLMKHNFHIILSVVSLGQWLPIYAVMFVWYKYRGSNVESRAIKKRLRKNLRTAQISARLAKPSGAGYKKATSLAAKLTVWSAHIKLEPENKLG